MSGRGPRSALRRFLVAVSLWAACLLPNAHAARIAVLEFQGDVLPLDQRIALADRVRTEAVQALADTSVRVMTQENMESILEDMGVDASAVCEGSCEVDTLRALQADYGIVGKLTAFGPTLVVSLQLYSTRQGNMLDARTLEGTSALELLRTSVPFATAELLVAIGGRAPESVAVPTPQRAPSVSAPTPKPGEPGVIGLRWQEIEGKHVVLCVFSDYGAAAAGMEAGDVLTSVDGKDVDFLGDRHAVVRALKGDAGTTVIVGVSKWGEEPERRLNVRRSVAGADYASRSDGLECRMQASAAQKEAQRRMIRARMMAARKACPWKERPPVAVRRWKIVLGNDAVSLQEGHLGQAVARMEQCAFVNTAHILAQWKHEWENSEVVVSPFPKYALEQALENDMNALYSYPLE